MRFLPRGIRLRNQGPRLAQTKTELAKQSLTLADAQLDGILLFNPCGQGLAVPEIGPHSCIIGFPSQHAIDFLNLCCTQPGRTSRPLSFGKSGQPLFLKAADPILDGSRRITEKASYFGTCNPLRHQEHTMQPVVISRFFRTLNLLLQSNHHRRSIGYG